MQLTPQGRYLRPLDLGFSVHDESGGPTVNALAHLTNIYDFAGVLIDYEIDPSVRYSASRGGVQTLKWSYDDKTLELVHEDDGRSIPLFHLTYEDLTKEFHFDVAGLHLKTSRDDYPAQLELAREALAIGRTMISKFHTPGRQAAFEEIKLLGEGAAATIASEHPVTLPSPYPEDKGGPRITLLLPTPWSNASINTRTKHGSIDITTIPTKDDANKRDTTPWLETTGSKALHPAIEFLNDSARSAGCVINDNSVELYAPTVRLQGGDDPIRRLRAIAAFTHKIQSKNG